MNSNYYPILFLIFIFISCQETNNFSSSEDILEIQTKKYKGKGVFSIGASKLHLKDTTEDFISTVIYPNDIKKIKRSEKCVDFAAHRFYRFKEGEKRLLDFLTKDISSNNIDTNICPPKTENYINIIEGNKNGKRV
jgi:hypothetical protein